MKQHAICQNLNDNNVRNCRSPTHRTVFGNEQKNQYRIKSPDMKNVKQFAQIYNAVVLYENK